MSYRLDWLKSYLTGRSQFVRFNGEVSATTPVTCGVLQGSVLGPVLFLLYAAGVINLVEECGFSAHAYADDETRQFGSILRAIGTDGELHLPSRSLDGQQPTAP